MDSVFMQCFVGCLFAMVLAIVIAYQLASWKLRKLKEHPAFSAMFDESSKAGDEILARYEVGIPRDVACAQAWSKVKCSRCGEAPSLDVLAALVRDNVPPPKDISTLLCEKCVPVGPKAVMRVTCEECGFDTALPVDVPPASHCDRTVMKSVQQATNAWLRNNHWKPVLGAWQCPDCAVISAG